MTKPRARRKGSAAAPAAPPVQYRRRQVVERGDRRFTGQVTFEGGARFVDVDAAELVKQVTNLTALMSELAVRVDALEAAGKPAAAGAVEAAGEPAVKDAGK